MDLDGLPVTMLDTAGLREAMDEVEGIGIERARARARSADLRIFLTSGGDLGIGLEPGPEDIVVEGKADLGRTGFAVSGLSGEGVDVLVARVGSILSQRAAHAGTAIRERHRLGMQRAFEGLEQARIAVEAGSEQTELAAEEIQLAIRALDSIVGRIDVENILDEIFSSFCIGK
jgi:tRNA modification GTPase